MNGNSKLPHPVTVEHVYLAAILTELQATNELLAALLAQGEPPVMLLGEPPVMLLGDSEQVTLREPKPKRKG